MTYVSVCRKSLSRVRQEILGMDVRIGVLEHTLMQSRLRDKYDIGYHFSPRVTIMLCFRSNMQRDYHNAINEQKQFFHNF